MERRGNFNEFALRQQLIQSIKNRLADLVCWFDSFRESHPDIAEAEATRSSEARQAFTQALIARIRQEYDHDACGQTNWWGLAKPCFEKTAPEHQEIINQFLIKRFQDVAHAIRDAGFAEWLNRQITPVDQQVESAKRILFASTDEDVAKAFHEFRATQEGEMRMDGVADLVSRISDALGKPANEDRYDVPNDHQDESNRHEQALLGNEPIKESSFAELLKFAHEALKGKGRAVIEHLCNAHGELPIADLAMKAGVDWDDALKCFEATQSRLNKRIKKLGWRIIRLNNNALLKSCPR